MKSARGNLQTTKSEKKEKQQLVSLTITLVNISFAFMILTLPNCILYLIQAGYDPTYM